MSVYTTGCLKVCLMSVVMLANFSSLTRSHADPDTKNTANVSIHVSGNANICVSDRGSVCNQAPSVEATSIKIAGENESKRGWLGLIVTDIDRNLAAGLGMDNPQGALVTKVLKGGPSDVAGIKVGDVILSYNGMDLASAADMLTLVRKDLAHTTTTLRISRDEKSQEIKVLSSELSGDGVRALGRQP